MCRGAPVPIPTVAEARKLREAYDRSSRTPVPPTDTQTIVADDVFLDLDSLIPQYGARVRRAKHTRDTVPACANVSPDARSGSGYAHQRPWTAGGQGKWKGKQFQDNWSSWPSRWNEGRE